MAPLIGRERRKVTRVKADTIGPLIIESSGHSENAIAEDISIMGVRLSTTRRFDERTILIVKRRYVAIDDTPIAAEVRHVTELPNGTGWHLGCRFLQALSANAFLNLG